MNHRTYNINLIGEIVVAKHSQSRRITIRLRPGSLPKVIIPRLMPFETGYRFAVEKQQWIIEHTEKINRSQATKPIFDEKTIFTTRFHQITIEKQIGKNITTQKTNNQIKLIFPLETHLGDPSVQILIKNYITNILRSEAKGYLPSRVELLARQHGFKYNKVAVKDVKSRWGSCSGTNNINLNIHLMRLPEHLSDYIILHELCHTVHKNHGERFHQLLEKITGGEKLLEKELKKYKTQF
jgi:predicted metal-dependent hydrolase